MEKILVTHSHLIKLRLNSEAGPLHSDKIIDQARSDINKTSAGNDKGHASECTEFMAHCRYILARSSEKVVTALGPREPYQSLFGSGNRCTRHILFISKIHEYALGNGIPLILFNGETRFFNDNIEGL